MTAGPRPVPGNASIAAPVQGDKLHAPAAARNIDPLLGLLRDHAPASGCALELASGTGQHVVAFARAFPALHWQPTDLDAQRLRSIDAYAAEATLANIAPAQALDATRPGWSQDHKGQDLIVLINLLHLISEGEAKTLITEAAKALATGGLLVLYGPFKRDGVLTSEGDQTFDQSLRAHDPAIGYKNDQTILEIAADAGLHLRHINVMPANNLAFVLSSATQTL